MFKDGLGLKSVPTSRPGLTSHIGGCPQNPSHPAVDSLLGVGRGLIIEIFEQRRPKRCKCGYQLRNKQMQACRQGPNSKCTQSRHRLKAFPTPLAICSYFPIFPLSITFKYLPKTDLHFPTTWSFFF